MTRPPVFVPKRGERVRVVEIHPSDTCPGCKVGDEVAVTHAFAVNKDYGWSGGDWVQMEGDGVKHTVCRVEPVPAEGWQPAPGEMCEGENYNTGQTLRGKYAGTLPGGVSQMLEDPRAPGNPWLVERSTLRPAAASSPPASEENRHVLPGERYPFKRDGLIRCEPPNEACPHTTLFPSGTCTQCGVPVSRGPSVYGIARTGPERDEGYGPDTYGVVAAKVGASDTYTRADLIHPGGGKRSAFGGIDRRIAAARASRPVEAERREGLRDAHPAAFPEGAWQDVGEAYSAHGSSGR